MIKVFISLAALLLAVVVVAEDDPFKTIKQDFAGAGCVQLEFLSVLESDIFDVVDTVPGRATISQDGRFSVSAGSDAFLYDNDRLYTYSEQTNQVIIEKPAGDLFVGSEIALVTRLDDYYATTVVTPGREYHLTKTDTTDTQLPDELTVLLKTGAETIESFKYLDLNGDLNRIIFQRQHLQDVCPDSAFAPDFPESAERIKL